MNSTVNNTFNTAVNNDTFNVVGTVNNIINISGSTGSYVNISFYFEPYNLNTGYNLAESFTSRDFFFTGYALGAINSGTSGVLSGLLYQRSPSNVKTNFANIVLSTGLFFYTSGGFTQRISGMNRVGIDILNVGNGVSGLSVGLFGVEI
jgi:hypothetical protein